MFIQWKNTLRAGNCAQRNIAAAGTRTDCSAPPAQTERFLSCACTTFIFIVKVGGVLVVRIIIAK